MKVIILSIVILSLILLIRLVFFFQNEHEYRVGDTLEQQFTLLSEPKIQFDRQIVNLNNVRIEVPFETELHYGDTIFVKGEITEDSFTAKNGDEVSLLTIKSAEINQIRTTNPFILSTAFIRSRVWEVFSRSIPQGEAGLLFGIVFGGTQGFDSDTRDAFRNTGVLHVVAASGMNVTLVAGFLFALASKFLKRRLAIILSIMGIFYYALIAGFEPSILRASIMAAVTFTAAILGRQNYAFLTLLLTAFVMIMIDPGNIFDIGFLLSFSSTMGIVAVKPLLDNLKLAKRTKGLSDDVTTTISAQVGSLPFMGVFFSSYSVISLIANALVLWTIPFLMILGGIAAVCSIAVPFVSFIPLYVALPMLWYFEKVIGIFGSIPLLQFSNIPGILWVGYYALLITILLHLKKRKKD